MSNSTPPDLLSQPTAPQEPQPLLTGGVYQGFENDLRAFRRNKADAEQELWAATMRQAIKTDPALYAEADRLALDQGVTADWAMRNIDNVRQLARFKEMRDSRIEQTNPTWFRSMQSLDFARKAWDDAQLPLLEQWGRALESGQLTTERGRIAAKAMIFGADGDKGRLSPEDLASLERIQQRQGEIGPVSGFFPSAAEIIGQQSKSLPEALLAGTAGGSASALATSFTGPGAGAAFVVGFKAAFWSTLAVNAFEVEAGNAYADMIQAGYDPDRSWNAAFGIGLANAALEMGGAAVATGGLRREVGRLLTKKALEESAKGVTSGFVRGFGKEYLKGVAGEATTEMMQELVNIAGEEAARRPGDASLSPEGIASRLWEVASKTTQGMALLGIPNAYAGGQRARAVAMAQKAKQDMEKLREAVKIGAQSPLAKNDPAAAEQFVAQAFSETNAPRTVTIDAATLRDVLAQADKAATDAGDGLTKSAADRLEAIVPGITEQIADQATQGGDVSIDTAKLATSIAQQLPDIALAIAEHGRTDAAMPSAAMAEEQQKEAEALAKQADTGTDAEKAFRESLAKVEEQVAKGFTETATSLRPAELRSVTRIAAEMVARIAEGENITPEQAWQRYGAAITNQPLTEEALQQPSTKTDTQEFKAWFGESKVVDAEGKPLMMYHGTAFSGFTQFNTYATNHGLMGSGAYFTDNPEVASSYSDKGATRLRFGVIPVPVEGAAPGVYRVWLSIKKPLDMDATAKVGQWERAFKEVDFPESGTNEQMFRAAEEWYRDNEFSRDDAGIEIQERIKSMGYDGITHIGGGRVQADSVRHRVYIAFDEGQIKSPSNRGTFDPKDPNILRQPARGGFIRRALAILFGEKSDVSTVLHELTHWYTEIVDRLAQQGSPWAVQQMGVLLNRWKLTREQWDAMPDADRASLYEDISYNAEEYFATGKAPSKELAGVFDKLRRFIVRVYSSVIKSFGGLRGGLEAAYREQFGRDLPAMTPELRGFFDRMLASDEAIEIVQAEREGAVAFDKASAKALGLDDATVAEVERLQAEAKDEAKAKLSAEAVRGARYFQAARRGAEKDAKAQLRAAEERVRGEVEQEMRDSPVQNAYRYLRDGTYENADGEIVKDPSARRLSSVTVRRILGLPAIKGGEKGTTLVGRIRQLGGIRLDSYPGEIKGEFSIPGVFRKEGGESWESIAQQLASEGYGGEVYDSDVAQNVDNMWLVDALTAAAQGERRYAEETVTESTRMQSEYQDWLRTQGQEADEAAKQARADQAAREAMFTKLARRGLIQKSEAQQMREAVAEAKRKRNGRKLSAEELRQVRESTTIVEGSDPDQIAALFGFGTGDEMLRALANMQLREEAIRRRVRERIEAEEPLADPKEMRRAVESATHGKAAARLASTILRAMLNNTRSTAQLEAAAQQAAKAVLSRTPVGQISVRGFSQAELRAAKAAREALKAGKVDEAIEAQRKHLLQHYLTRFAIDIESELDKFNDTVGGSYLKPDAEVIKAKRDLDRVQAIRSILGKYEAIGRAKAEAADAYLGTMAEQNPEGHRELAARIAAATASAKPWRLVQLDRWRQVMEESAQLWHESKRSEQVRINGVLRQRQDVQEELEAALVDAFGDPTKTPPQQTVTDWDPATWLSSLQRLESLMLALDGGKVGGPWHRYVYRTLNDAQTALVSEKLVEKEWYRGQLEKHGDLAGPAYDGKKWLGDTFSKFENRAAIVGMLYQLGTEGNQRNLFIGNGWAWQKDGELYAHDGRPFMPVFQDMLRDMVERGYLRKEDFDTAQEGWDHIGERLKPRLFDTSREVWGFYPKEVEATPFDTPFGKYPGGYFPSKVDKANSNVGNRAKLDAVGEMRSNFVDNHATVPRGMTIARQAGAKQPRVMNVRLLWSHIEDTLNIIHLAAPSKDVAGLFRTGSLQDSLRSADKNALNFVIFPAIDRLAAGSIVAPSDSGLLRFVNYAKQATSTMFLGLNPRNAAQQLTGLSNAALYSSFGEVWSAFWKFSRNPAKNVAQVEKYSQYMVVRWSNEMQALAADIEQMLAPSTIGKVQEVASRWAFVMQRYMQMTTDAIAWSAAFEHHLPSVGEAEAVARADSAVRLSQGTKTPLDVPRALAGNAVAQLFTQFADYPNVVLNSVMSPPEGRRFAAVMLALVTPTLGSSLIALAFAGGRLGKGARDDDDTPEEIIAKLVGDQIKGAFSMVPAVGGTVGATVVGLIDTIAEVAFGKQAPKLGGETTLRNSPFAAQALVETVQRIAGGNASPRDMAAFASLLTRLPLMPFGNAFNYMERVDEGKSRPTGPVDYTRGLLLGR